MNFFRGVIGKIRIGIAVAFLGYLISLIMFLLFNINLNTNLSDLQEKYYPISLESIEMIFNFSKQSKNFEDAILLGDDMAIDSAKELHEEIQKSLETIYEKNPDDDLLKLKNVYTSYFSKAEPIFRALAEGSEDPKIQQQVPDIIKVQNQVKNDLSSYSDLVKDHVNQVMINQQKNSKKGLWINISLFFAILIVVLLGVNYISKKLIVTHIQNIRDMMQDLAEGEVDLTKRLSVETDDEIGELASWGNVFIENLQTLMKDVNVVINDLSYSSEELLGIADSLTNASELMNNDTFESAEKAGVVTQLIDEIVSTIEHVKQNVSHLADNASKVATNISMVSDSSDLISSRVNDVIDSIANVSSKTDSISENINMIVDMVNNSASAIEELSSTLNEVSVSTQKGNSITESAAQKAKEANKVINELKIASEAVGKFVQVISGIADQTNMLALNATIEAASAGEAGAGFAVVANEVKQLAKQSAEAADSITQQISTMENATNNAVDSITEITEVINEIAEINRNIDIAIEQQNTATKEISYSISTAANSANEVGVFAQGIAESVNDVKTNTHEVGSSINEIAQNTSELSQFANEMAQTSNEVNREVAQVYNNTIDISSAIKEIVSKIEMISSRASETSDNAKTTDSNATGLNELAVKLKNMFNRFNI